jgi:hypothetical protein
VLTIDGKAELVVQDAEAYQALLDRVEAIEGIQRGLADVKAVFSPNFGQPTVFMDPRRVMVGVRMNVGQ